MILILVRAGSSGGARSGDAIGRQACVSADDYSGDVNSDGAVHGSRWQRPMTDLLAAGRPHGQSARQWPTGVPGLKLHDDRVIRLLQTLLHPAGFARDWTTREAHARIPAEHRLADNDYRLSQLRYDLAKLRVKGLVERLGRTRRYRLTNRAPGSACCSSSYALVCSAR